MDGINGDIVIMAPPYNATDAELAEIVEKTAASVRQVLRDEGVSLESMLQRGRSPGEAVPVVLITHETGEAAMRAALVRIAALNAVLEEPALIRIEPA